MHVRRSIAILILTLPLSLPAQQAPGAPGAKPYWTNGNKVGVGTAVTENSRVWFTLGRNGALNAGEFPAFSVGAEGDQDGVCT